MNHVKGCESVSDRERNRFLRIAEAMHINEDAAIPQAILEFIANHARALNE